MVFKRHLTPLRKGGRIDKHNGKGATEQPLPNRATLGALSSNPGASTMNDYAKATPLANPVADPPNILGE